MLVAIVRTDGGVSIMNVIDAKDVDGEVEKWKGVHAGEYSSHSEIDGAIPPDRTFRDAWETDGKYLTVNMARAREIHKNRMRLARGPKLAALDVEYQRADEIGDSAAKKSVSGRKQVLRDITKIPAIEASRTPEELRAAWPKELD